MKKLSTYLFLILFSVQTSSLGSSISDFQVEGISIGDSLLDYMSEEEIKNNFSNLLGFNLAFQPDQDPQNPKNGDMRKIHDFLQNWADTYYGKKFERWNIRDILKQPLYCGVISWKGETKESSYEPIVSKRLFNQIQTSF